MHLYPAGPVVSRWPGIITSKRDRRATQRFANVHVTPRAMIAYLLPEAVPRCHAAPVPMQRVIACGAAGCAGRAWAVDAGSTSRRRTTAARRTSRRYAGPARTSNACERPTGRSAPVYHAPPVTVSAPDPRTVLAELETADRLLVQQVFKPIANEYRISAPTPGSTEEGRPLLYVKQKKMKIKEDIRFRVAPDDGGHLFMIKSKSVFEFRGRHEVLDGEGALIGTLEKDFGRSLVRSHWHVRDASGAEVLEAYESSWIVALVRRFADIGVDWLSVLSWLPFNFVLRRGDREVGRYTRVLGKFRDRYVLELGPDAGEIDRRLLAAFTVGLDALQDR